MEYELLSKLYYKDKERYEAVYNSRIGCKDCLYVLPLSIGKGNPVFFILSKEVNKLMQDIYIRNNKLSRLYNNLPMAAQRACLKKSMIDEILLSNDIEGVYSTRKELHFVMKTRKTSKQIRLQGLVNKYHMILRPETIPLSDCKDIRHLYDEMLLDEIDPKAHPDGIMFRKDSVSVYSQTDKEIHQGINPEKRITDYMIKALEFLHDDSVPHILRISVFHYLFGYIHPFYDGNGRLSRFISSYLIKETLNFLVSFRISHVISSNKSIYYNAFKDCNDPKNRGDITPFVMAFLEIIYQAIESLITELIETNNKLSHYHKSIKNIEENAIKTIGKNDKKTLNNQYNIHAILYAIVQNSLFNDESISINDLAQTAKLSVNWTRNCLKELVERGYVLKEKNVHSFLYAANFAALDAQGELNK